MHIVRCVLCTANSSFATWKTWNNPFKSYESNVTAFSCLFHCIALHWNGFESYLIMENREWKQWSKDEERCIASTTWCLLQSLFNCYFCVNWYFRCSKEILLSLFKSSKTATIPKEWKNEKKKMKEWMEELFIKSPRRDENSNKASVSVVQRHNLFSVIRCLPSRSSQF